MRMKVWLMAAAALAVLAVGVGGGAVLAQESGSGDRSPVQGFVSRVAEILGLEEQVVEDAFTQAKQEMADEGIERKLAAAVESGRLTQEQADEIRAWYDAKPDSIGPWSRHPQESGRRSGERQAHAGAGGRDTGVVRLQARFHRVVGQARQGLRPQALAWPQRSRRTLWRTLREGRPRTIQGANRRPRRRLGLTAAKERVS